MKENLIFGVDIDQNSLGQTISKLKSAFQELESSIGGISNDFNDVFSSQGVQNAAKLKGEAEGLYGNVKGASGSFKSLNQDSGLFGSILNTAGGAVGKLQGLTAGAAREAVQFSASFIKLPFTILSLVSGFVDIKALIGEAFKEFEKLTEKSIELQKFFQSSKSFGDGLVKTAQTVSKDLVGVSVDQVAGFMKKASEETKGFFNVKEIDKSSIESINNLAGALGISFDEAAAKYTKFVTGDTSAVTELSQDVGRLGITMTDLSSASQQAQAGLAGANARGANFSALINSKLKNSNDIAKQSVGGLQDIIGKNLAAISTSFIDPLYEKIRQVFVTILNFIKSNEGALRAILSGLANAIVPIFDFAIGLIQKAGVFLSGMVKGGNGVGNIFNMLMIPVKMLGDLFKTLFGVVESVFSVLIQPDFLKFYQDVYFSFAQLSSVVLDTVLPALTAIGDTFKAIGTNTSFTSSLFSAFKQIADSFVYTIAYFGALLDPLVKKVSQFFIGFSLNLTKVNFFEFIADQFKKITGLIQSYADYISSVFNLVINIFSKIFNNPAVLGGVMKFFNSIVSPIIKIGSFILSIGKNLMNFISGIVDSINFDIVGEIISSISGVIDSIVITVENLYKAFILPIIDTLKSYFSRGDVNSFFGELKSIFNEIFSYINIFFNKISDFFSLIGKNANLIAANFENIFGIGDKLFRIFNLLSDSLKGMWGNIKDIFDGFKNIFSGDIGGGASKIGSALLDMLMNLGKTIFDAIYIVFEEFIDNFTLFLSNIFNNEFVKRLLPDGFIDFFQKKAIDINIKRKIEEEKKPIRSQIGSALDLIGDTGLTESSNFKEKFSVDNLYENRDVEGKNISALLGNLKLFRDEYNKQKEDLVKNSNFYDEKLFKTLQLDKQSIDFTKLDEGIQKKIILYKSLAGDSNKFNSIYNKKTKEILNKNVSSDKEIVDKFNLSSVIKEGTLFKDLDESILNRIVMYKSLTESNDLKVSFDVSKVFGNELKTIQDANAKMDKGSKEKLTTTAKVFDKVGSTFGEATKDIQRFGADLLNSISKLPKQQRDYFNALRSYQAKLKEYQDETDPINKELRKKELEGIANATGQVKNRLSEVDKTELSAVGGEKFLEMFKDVANSMKETFNNGILVTIDNKTDSAVQVTKQKATRNTPTPVGTAGGRK